MIFTHTDSSSGFHKHKTLLLKDIHCTYANFFLQERLPVILSHYPAGSSTKAWVHYGQIMRTGIISEQQNKKILCEVVTETWIWGFMKTLPHYWKHWYVTGKV
jgi:hypothetical protein